MDGYFEEDLRAAKEQAAAVFGRNQREARERAGVSQERLSDLCELHRAEISLLERGGREPRLSTIMRLARGLGMSPDALLDGLE